MDDYPVKVGSMLFTMVDPHRGHEVAYNRWYERDHFYAGCLIGPWLFAGGRWVATRALKDLRFPADSPFADPVDAGSYLSIYWVHEGHEAEHFAWATKQVRWLYANGRGFAERTHAHTALYSLVARHQRDADSVPLELALDHGYDGLGACRPRPSPPCSSATGAVASPWVRPGGSCPWGAASRTRRRARPWPSAPTVAARTASCSCCSWREIRRRPGNGSVPMRIVSRRAGPAA